MSYSTELSLQSFQLQVTMISPIQYSPSLGSASLPTIYIQDVRASQSAVLYGLQLTFGLDVVPIICRYAAKAGILDIGLYTIQYTATPSLFADVTDPSDGQPVVAIDKKDKEPSTVRHQQLPVRYILRCVHSGLSNVLARKIKNILSSISVPTQGKTRSSTGIPQVPIPRLSQR